MAIYNWTLFAVIVLLSIGDAVVAVRMRRRPGGRSESNRLMAVLIARLGLVPAVAAVRIPAVAFLAVVVYRASGSLLLPNALVLLIGFYCWVVINTLSLLRSR